MRIVHLSTSDRGGAGIAAVRLHNALLNKGIDSNLLTMHRFTNNISKHIKYLPGAGDLFPFVRNGIYKMKKAMKYYGLPTSAKAMVGGPTEALAQVGHLEEIRRNHLANRPPGYEHFSFPFSDFNLNKHPLIKSADIIHLHWVSDGFLDYKSFFSGSKKKLVWTLHDMNPFTGGCHHSDDCIKFRAECNSCPQLKGTIDDNYSAFILKEKIKSLSSLNNEQLTIVTPSEWLGKLSGISLLFSRFHHEVIPNAFNSSEFYPIDRTDARKKLGLPIDKKIVLFNSHHIDNPRKGFSFLLKSLKELDTKNIILCAAGHLLDKLEVNNVINLGYLNSEEQMTLAYSAADVFVLPSLAENFPNTICESILCGTPVVAFNVGGIPEIINYENGRLAGLKNIAEMSNAIKAVLFEDQFDRRTFSSKAKSLFDSAVVADKYIHLYRKN